jgi:predicted TIM-barrel fold metal-dependent hydrolase
VPFVLYHMGFGTQHQDSIETAREAKTKRDALIYLETAQSDADSVLKSVEAVGADRIVFGTDATYFGRNHYEYYIPILQALKKALPAADYKRIIHDNAVQLFRLEEK